MPGVGEDMRGGEGLELCFKEDRRDGKSRRQGRHQNRQVAFR